MQIAADHFLPTDADARPTGEIALVAGGPMDFRQMRSPGPGSPAIEGGIAWLVREQAADGGWDEDAFTGTGFPLDFMIKYHYYRLYFPVMALGRCAA